MEDDTSPGQFDLNHCWLKAGTHIRLRESIGEILLVGTDGHQQSASVVRVVSTLLVKGRMRAWAWKSDVKLSKSWRQSRISYHTIQ